MALGYIPNTHLNFQRIEKTYILWRSRFTLKLDFQNGLDKKKLPLLELAIVAAIASCVASVTTDTWNGVVQSEKKILNW